MVKGSKGRILQIRLFSTIPNPQTNQLEHYDVHWKSFSWIPHMPNFRSGGLMVDGTVNCKDNEEEKTREVAGIRMHHISWNFLSQRCDMPWLCWLTWELFILSRCLTILSICELVVDDTVDGMDNLEAKTREVTDMRMSHISWNFLESDLP